MHERLSFYVQRESILHRLNPLTKLTLAFAAILVSFSFPWLWISSLLVLVLVLPLSIFGKVWREYLNVALRLLLPAALFIFVMQSIFLPVGETVLLEFWVLDVKAEALAQAYQTATRIFLMISSFVIVLLSTHPSELMGDLTRRGLPGQFAYVIVSTLQIIPQMQAKAQTIIAAQRSRGLETEGSYFKRISALVPLVRPLVFGSLVEVEERAIAIEARGFTSTRAKSFLRDIPDTPAEKIIRWALVLVVLLSFLSNYLWPW